MRFTGERQSPNHVVFAAVAIGADADPCFGHKAEERLVDTCDLPAVAVGQTREEPPTLIVESFESQT